MPIDVDRLKAALADRYRVEREIGRGGMATVYLAEDLKHKRQVAVKVLEPELASHLGARRFLREIETAARLNHPHILPLYDSGEADGILYYVMPYMSGDSLRDRLSRERQLPIEEAVRLAQDVARGLDYAHEQGVVHRDIKPGNIMLSRGHAVIADFGIARAVVEAGDDKVTQTGVSLGSPTYMSPEQATGSDPVDGRSDTYALGCVLYEMLAGQPPFSGGTATTVMARKQLESPPRLDTVRDTVPAALDDAVARALAKVPADRYQTAGEFASALAAIQGPVRAEPAPSDAAPTAGRRGVPRWVIGIAALAVVLVAGWLLVRPDQSADSQSSASDAASADVRGTESADLRSIAVLPFDTSSAEGDDAAFFAEGIHHETMSQLSKIATLNVLSRRSVMQYVGSTKTGSEIAAELGAGAILEGLVQRFGDRLRVFVQLIDARENSNIWSDTYDREITANNIFAIQTEIAEHVASALEATLTPAEQARLRAQPTANLEAYELYVRGVLSLDRFLLRFQPRDIREAIEYLGAAVELDPDFAEAHAQLANAYFGSAFPGLSEEEVRQVVSTAERALALDPTIGEAHAVLALVAEETGDTETAEAEYRRAIELSPSFAGVREWYGELLLRHFGRASEALQQYQRAHELDPTSLRASAGLGLAYYLSRDYGAAIQHVRGSLEVDPEPILATSLMYRALASALAESGMYDEAIETELMWSALLGEDTPACLDVCAIALARSGRAEEARERLDDLIAWVDARPDETNLWRKPDKVARVYAALGEPDLAFEWLDKGSGAYAYLKLDPQWDPLRSDPRFDDLLRRAGLEN